MLDYLKPLKGKSFDCLTFIPGEKENSLRVEGSDFVEPGEILCKHDLGDMYYILIYKEDEEKGIHEVDLFEGILGDPLEYASKLIPNGWYGVFAKKTTTSGINIEKAFDTLKKM
jgi:hypothetical protein